MRFLVRKLLLERGFGIASDAESGNPQIPFPYGHSLTQGVCMKMACGHFHRAVVIAILAVMAVGYDRKYWQSKNIDSGG